MVLYLDCSAVAGTFMHIRTILLESLDQCNNLRLSWLHKTVWLVSWLSMKHQSLGSGLSVLKSYALMDIKVRTPVSTHVGRYRGKVTMGY